MKVKETTHLIKSTENNTVLTGKLNAHQNLVSVDLSCINVECN